MLSCVLIYSTITRSSLLLFVLCSMTMKLCYYSLFCSFLVFIQRHAPVGLEVHNHITMEWHSVWSVHSPKAFPCTNTSPLSSSCTSSSRSPLHPHPPIPWWRLTPPPMKKICYETKVRWVDKWQQHRQPELFTVSGVKVTIAAVKKSCHHHHK